MARRRARVEKPALLVRVLTEVGSGHIREAWLADRSVFVHGETTGRVITINPAVGIVDTLIHETLHRLEPSWSERYVRNRTSWLMRRMSDEQIQALHDEFTKRATRMSRRARTAARAGLSSESAASGSAASAAAPGALNPNRGRDQPG